MPAIYVHVTIVGLLNRRLRTLPKVMSLTARAAGETVSSVMTAGGKGELVVIKKAEAGVLLHYLRPGTILWTAVYHANFLSGKCG